MIVYCDTSALVKLYIVEAGAERMHELCAEALAMVTCRITWAEMYSALSRRGRQNSADLPGLKLAREAFSEDWPCFVRIEITQELVEKAGFFAEAFGLRGYDSIQLASAYFAARQTEGHIALASFDRAMNQAASVLGMATPFLDA
jgi:predicted nucleic acid-binding protein